MPSQMPPQMIQPPYTWQKGAKMTKSDINALIRFFSRKANTVFLLMSASSLISCPPSILNKAGYTATPVACGWAGAVFELLKHLGRSGEAKDRKNIKKVKWGPTDQPTNRLTDQPTDKAGCSVT